MPPEAPGKEPVPAFDIRADLPTGTTVLEASAGTGKTWTIAALATRYVAEGRHTLDELLVVTFSRAASQEVRERVREQLTVAARVLAHPDRVTARNPLLEHLLDAPPDELVRRERRLRTALASFDEATIATIHQFCQLVLKSLGVAGDTDAQATLVEDLDDLLVEVVDDLYVRGFAGQAGAPEFTRATALAIAHCVVGDSGAAITPDESEVGPGSAALRRVRFAHAVRCELDRRKRRLGILSYDDLLSRLADALRDPDAPARDRMRRRWKVVLIDEFQDTDPVQWQVFERAFSGHATMVLIGDPKQAIYAFRGGDVVTYLQAAETAGERRTLATNWRSDGPLVDAVQTLFAGTALGDPRIRVHDVRARHESGRLRQAPLTHPLRLRVVDTEQCDGGLSRDGRLVLVGALRPFLAVDAARDIVRLLDSDARWGDGGDARPVQPNDIAVLAFTNSQLRMVQDALRARGVPAVVAGAGSVFRAPAAQAWLAVLEGMEQPHRARLVRAAALTPLLGLRAEQLDRMGDVATDQAAAALRRWAAIYARRGFAAVFEASQAHGLSARVLRRTGGERELTDLRHLAEALHEASLREHHSLAGLIGWLRERMAPDRPRSGDALTRRLDSDATAVQLCTIHGSKGLEYPVVYLPFLADRWVDRKSDRPPLFHQPGRPPVRSVDVGGPHCGLAGHQAAALAEDAGESLRLMYVALTRAKSQVVTWWAPGSTTADSPLHRVLAAGPVGRDGGQQPVADKRAVPPSADMRRILDAWAAAGGPRWERADDLTDRVITLPPVTAELAARDFDRVIDTSWRRTSYTALSRAAAEAAAAPGGVDSEAEEQLTEAELGPIERPAAAVPDGTGGLSPMRDLPVGATFGSLVHAVLEQADPTAADLHAQLARQAGRQLLRWPVPLSAEELADAMLPLYDTPLGPLADDVTLRQIGRDRLAELEFELPLAGGDDSAYPADRVLLGGLERILRRHLHAGDPLLPYADQLEQVALGGQVLRGYLTGSVDVVLRVDGRYLVADYKTNWLGPLDEPLPLLAYDRPALEAAMSHSDYPLQALLYAVVLHRYLRWRLPGYDPERHLGGVLYLYLRGMGGPDTPRPGGWPTGVFSWRPPVALVEEISDLLDGVPPERGEPA